MIIVCEHNGLGCGKEWVPKWDDEGLDNCPHCGAVEIKPEQTEPIKDLTTE